ncbi:hypothetical protein ACFQT0_17930 [Hymenobacter humi]|uniref:DUF4132 domain-containing protein n=1 Tax=Hymenobacter humi TaxID=1411620 RepID=A0ABW2U966_9BACT
MSLLRYLNGKRKKAATSRPWGYNQYSQQPYHSNTYHRWARTAVEKLRELSIYLPAEKQVRWWLEGVGVEPDTSVLQVQLPKMTDKTLEKVWQEISLPNLPAIVSSLRSWLEQELPLSWTSTALRQLQNRHGDFVEAARRLLQESVISQLPAAEQLVFWEQALTGQPTDELLREQLTFGLPETAIRVIKKLATGSLPTILPAVFGRLAAESALAEQALKRLADDQHLEPAARRLKADLLEQLVPSLSRDQSIAWWLADLLPPPALDLLVEEIGSSTRERQWRLLSKCPPTLLQEYCQVLHQGSKGDDNRTALIRDCAVLLSKLLGEHEEFRETLSTLLALVDSKQQLRWWLDGAAIEIEWQVIELGLTQSDVQQAVAIRATQRHLQELVEFLPNIPSTLLPQLVDVLASPSMVGHLPAAKQVAGIVALARVLCQRYTHDLRQLMSWLPRLLQRCESFDLNHAYRSYQLEASEERTSVEEAVAYYIAPNLTGAELLQLWEAKLLGYFPLVPLEEIARMAMSDTSLSLQRLAVATHIPYSVIIAWRRMATLPGSSQKQFQEMTRACAESWNHRELLQGINSWLSERLTHKELEWLWMYGHPLAPPKDWSDFEMEDRIATAILYEREPLLPELPKDFAPNEDEIWEWLALQYWEEESQPQAAFVFGLIKEYYGLKTDWVTAWEALEDELLLRCIAVVKVRLWLTCPEINRKRTFNYYAFRRGFGRLRAAEQRSFLSTAHAYMKLSLTKALHSKRRRQLSNENGVSVYRASLAHCFCPQDGYLEIELADKLHTQPFAYPEAKVEWNEKLLLEPWAGCPILAYVDVQSRELLQIKGLEAALIRHPPNQGPLVVFTPPEGKGRSNGNPVSYPQDEVLHDELTEYLTKLADGVRQEAVVIEEARVKREYKPRDAFGEAEEAPDIGHDDIEDLEGALLQPRQTVLYPIVLQEEIVFVWASRFANSNQATYLFRAPALEQRQALERLTTVLQLVGRIRSALLAPGRVSHRLRRHLGYVCNIRGRRGHAQAFEQWQARLDKALEDGPSFQHPYDSASDWQMSELEVGQRVQEDTPDVGPPAPTRPEVVRRASQLLEQLRLLNQTFLSQYAT